MKLPVSIIIPTYNEEAYLPDLLQSIKRQTKKPAEVIVADANSLDRTREVARRFGCIVVNGGKPAKGRNNGAKKAKSELLLFLDSDVILPKDFLEKTVAELYERKLDIASCYFTPLSSSWVDHYLHQTANYYMKLTSGFYPHAPGFCIYSKKWVHHKINGFNEKLVLAEDHDYVRRAEKVAKLRYLKSRKIPVSVRRTSEDGRLSLVLKYIAVEIYRAFFGEITWYYFNYAFGRHYVKKK